MARSALAAHRSGAAESDRVVTARFYCETLLPQAAGLRPAATAGAAAVLAARFSSAS